MKMKKLGSLMMVGVLVGTMLVGCGKGSSYWIFEHWCGYYGAKQ